MDRERSNTHLYIHIGSLMLLLISGHCCLSFSLKQMAMALPSLPPPEAEAYTSSPMNIKPVIQTSEGMRELVHSTGEATLPTGHKWRMFPGTLFCPSALSVKDDARMMTQ